ncbi:MAG TPA: aminotransferase class I/II-fold pyridoxal phosphate-dependent enzyme [Actinobacteria bacterium]|nr:aminotransferase class I/II-fold pyridoxal phosphate-dependent enzyme [Actinomycetota bacterium]
MTDLAGDLARLRHLSGIKWNRYPDDVLPCWVADMDIRTAPVITEALEDLVRRGDFGYNFSAAAALPDAWVAWQTARHGWRPDVERVRVFSDVLQAVDLALWFGTRSGDGVVLLTPVYPPFFRCVESIGRVVVDCPLDPAGWRLGRDLLDEAIERAAAEGITTRAVLLCNPHNPTGRVFGPHELAAVAEVARERDLLVISDEIWGDIIFDGRRHIPFASISDDAAARTVTASAASKTFSVAGLRCAVAHLGVEKIESGIAGLPGHMLGAVSTPGAVASYTGWTQGGPWVEETVRFLASQRDHVRARITAELPRVRMNAPEATYLAWLDLRDLGLGDDPAAWLLEHARVALGSGPDFGVHGHGYARLNFATTRAVLDEALDRIVRALG